MSKKWNVIIRTRCENLEMLADALYSVAAQTYTNRSVILVAHNTGDAQFDTKYRDLETLLEKLTAVVEIKLLRQEGGLRSAPLNLALKNLDGEYMSFLDYDDVYYPHFGEVLIRQIEKGAGNFVYGNSVQVIQIRADNMLGERYFYNSNKYKIYGYKFNRVRYFLENFIPINTFVITKALVSETTFDEKLYVLEDWDFVTQNSLKPDFKPLHVDVNISEYRLRNDNSNSRNDNPEVERQWEESRQIIKKKNRNKKVSLDVSEIYALGVEEYNSRNAVAVLSLEKSNLERQVKLYKYGPIYLMAKAFKRIPGVAKFIQFIR